MAFSFEEIEKKTASLQDPAAQQKFNFEDIDSRTSSQDVKAISPPAGKRSPSEMFSPSVAQAVRDRMFQDYVPPEGLERPRPGAATSIAPIKPEWEGFMAEYRDYRSALGRGLLQGSGSLIQGLGWALNEIESAMTPIGYRGVREGVGLNRPEVRNALERSGGAISGATDIAFGPQQIGTSYDVAQTIGAMAPLLASAPLGPTGLVVAGAAMGAGQAQQEAQALGLDGEQARTYTYAASALGATEAVPISRLFSRLSEPVKKTLSTSLVRRVLNRAATIGGGSAANAGEESLQEFVQNVGLEYTKDRLQNPDKPIVDSVTEATSGVWQSGSLKTAAIVGALFGGFGGLVTPIEYLPQPTKNALTDPDIMQRIKDRVFDGLALRRADVKDIPGLERSTQEDRNFIADSVRDGSLESALAPLNQIENEARMEALTGERPGVDEQVQIQEAAQIYPEPIPETPQQEALPTTEAQPDVFSAKHASTEELRDALGLQPRTQQAGIEIDQILSSAERMRIERGDSFPDRLLSKVKAGETLNSVETAVLLQETIRLSNARKRFLSDKASEIARAIRSGDENPQASKGTIEAIKESEKRINDILDAMEQSGSEQGRAFRFRQVLLNQQMEEVHMLREAEGLKGAPLTPSEKDNIRDLSRKAKELKQAEAEQQARSGLERESRAVDETLAETIKEVEGEETSKAGAQEPAVVRAIEKVAKRLKPMADQARARILDRMQGRLFSTPLDPEMLADLSIVAASRIASGAASTARLTADLVSEFGDWVRPHVDDILSRAMALYDKEVDKGTRLASKKTKAKVKAAVSKPDTDTDADVAGKALRKIESKFKDGDIYSISPQVRTLAKEFIRGGTRDLQVLLDQLMEAIEPVAPGITRRHVGMAFSGYGDFTPLSQDVVEVEYRRTRREEQLLLQLQDLEEKGASLRSGRPGAETSKEHRAIQKKINAVKRKLAKERIGKPGFDQSAEGQARHRTAVEASEARLRHIIEDMTEEIVSGQKAVKDKGPEVTSPNIEALREVRDELKVLYDQIFPPEGKHPITEEQRARTALRAVQKAIEARKKNIEMLRSGQTPISRTLGKRKPPESPEISAARTEERLLKTIEDELMAELNPALEGVKENIAYRRRALEDIADKKRQMAEKDFTPKPRKEPKLDPESLRIKVEREKVVEQWHKDREKFRWESLNKVDKAGEITLETLNASRVLLTNFIADVSAIGRQGWFILHSRPGTWARGLSPMLRAMRSRDGQLMVAEEIKSRPNYVDGTYFKAKLIKPLEGGIERGVAGMEETTASKFVRRIWGFGAAARAYDTFMLRVRVDAFDAALEQMRSHGVEIPTSELESLSYYINTATGRYPGRKIQGATQLLNSVFLAPKFVISNFSMAGGVPLWRALKRGDTMAAKIIAQDYLKSAATVSMLIGLAGISGVEFEDDWRSKNFAHFKIGKRWVSPFGGLPSVLNFIGRLKTGEQKDYKGRIKPLVPTEKKGLQFGSRDIMTEVASFIRGKLAPFPGAIVSGVSRKDFKGDYIGWAEAIRDMYMPITLQTFLETAEEKDLAHGLFYALLDSAGIGNKPTTYKKRKN